MYLNIEEVKDVIQNNIQTDLIMIQYYDNNEQKTRIPKTNRLDNHTKEVKIELSFNGHLENCICKKCHEARVMLILLRSI